MLRTGVMLSLAFALAGTVGCGSGEVHGAQGKEISGSLQQQRVSIGREGADEEQEEEEDADEACVASRGGVRSVDCDIDEEADDEEADDVEVDDVEVGDEEVDDEETDDLSGEAEEEDDSRDGSARGSWWDDFVRGLPGLLSGPTIQVTR